MGRKRIRKRKHFYGFFAGLILLLVCGCSYFEKKCPSLEKDRFSGDLQHAAELYARGDFDGSRIANQHIMTMSRGKPPEDQALFNMGLIYASNKNPKKDYRKSMAFFQRVVKEYPQSPLTAQARTWIGVLEVIEKSKDVDVELEKKKKRLMR